MSLYDSVAMVDLLESTGVKVLSRKHLTTHTWGIVSYGCLAATNALVGGTMRDHLSSHYTRRVAAHALRDCRLVSRCLEPMIYELIYVVSVWVLLIGGFRRSGSL